MKHIDHEATLTTLIVQYRSDNLSPDSFVLSSPGIASNKVFRSKSAPILKIVHDDNYENVNIVYHIYQK